MTYETIVCTVTDHIATIELNRPEAMNSIDQTMLDELTAVFAQTNADPDVRVVVVTGRGRAYCAGADLSGGSASLDAEERGWAEEIDEFRDGGGLITLQIFESTKPVIGAVNGVAAGLGATMLLPMDIILASETARFGFVFAKRGIVPEACSTWFLPKKVGVSTAAEWFYTGRMVPAAEALEAGLVRSVHAPDDLLPAAYALAREIVENTAPVAVGMIRQMLWRFAGSEHPMDAHRIDSRINFELGRTPDVVEGITSFLEKRPPQFPGRLPGDAPSSYPWWTEPSFRQ
ncbi:crotonase/enoyl-CoA hydratase family protein [Aeromicrobium wangtongii]|uniref:Crotonase/enoyl-CoA hydratase family protein n=1 Tax=Aeromicrobium wangtongii TaxID=2969247 RepID=A0ABY5M8Z4_9ACTN|nr:crotonase/enoyl-CoA hydratase family protein [Aeromicrobium wangtongii]MCD9199869.1 crotonase/enoyl-CoA hydratase family protein [Aeromicrobium wangtongii]UUP13488.1 crotonase/enoyl-CoA hydratase family protein [Aeromicrobium wangtongii]